MAIYHLSTKPISRSSGRSAVAAAAYRAGVVLVDMRTGQVHDYTRKAGVVHTEIFTPDGLGADREALWNAAEAAEKRKDSRTAREWIAALPYELSDEQKKDLARSFARALAERYGVAVDFAIHAPDRRGDQRNGHAHFFTTVRKVTRNQAGDLVFGEKALLELSDKKLRQLGLKRGAAEEVEAVRQLWEQEANLALERAGRSERIDRRSLREQGIDREPTTHLGVAASGMERKGIRTDRGDINRAVKANAVERADCKAEIISLEREAVRREKIVDARVWRRKTHPSWEIQDRWNFRRRQRKEMREAEEFFERQEQERQPGIRHPDKPRWQAERERILTEVYGEAVAERLGRWYRIERRADALVLRNSAAEVTDHGDRVTAATGNDKEIEAMVLLAQAKGWSEVELTGSEEFRERAAQAFLKAGISIFDKELESRVLASTQTQDDVSLPFQWDLHQEAGELDIGNRSPHGMENDTYF